MRLIGRGGNAPGPAESVYLDAWVPARISVGHRECVRTRGIVGAPCV